MPALLALVFGRVISWSIGALVLKVIASLGVGFIVLTGVGILIDATFDQIQSLTTGLSANVVSILGLLNIDRAIAVIAAAYSVRLTLSSFKKLTFGAPAA